LFFSVKTSNGMPMRKNENLTLEAAKISVSIRQIET